MGGIQTTELTIKKENIASLTPTSLQYQNNKGVTNYTFASDIKNKCFSVLNLLHKSPNTNLYITFGHYNNNIYHITDVVNPEYIHVSNQISKGFLGYELNNK